MQSSLPIGRPSRETQPISNKDLVDYQPSGQPSNNLEMMLSSEEDTALPTNIHSDDEPFEEHFRSRKKSKDKFNFTIRPVKKNLEMVLSSEEDTALPTNIHSDDEPFEEHFRSRKKSKDKFNFTIRPVKKNLEMVLSSEEDTALSTDIHSDDEPFEEHFRSRKKSKDKFNFTIRPVKKNLEMVLSSEEDTALPTNIHSDDESSYNIDVKPFEEHYRGRNKSKDKFNFTIKPVKKNSSPTPLSSSPYNSQSSQHHRPLTFKDFVGFPPMSSLPSNNLDMLIPVDNIAFFNYDGKESTSNFGIITTSFEEDSSSPPQNRHSSQLSQELQTIPYEDLILYQPGQPPMEPYMNKPYKKNVKKVSEESFSSSYDGSSSSAASSDDENSYYDFDNTTERDCMEAALKYETMDLHHGYKLNPLLTNPSWEPKKSKGEKHLSNLVTKVVKKNFQDASFLWHNKENLEDFEDYASDEELVEKRRKEVGNNDFNEDYKHDVFEEYSKVWRPRKHMRSPKKDQEPKTLKTGA